MTDSRVSDCRVYGPEQGVLVGTGLNLADDMLRDYAGQTHSPREYEHPIRTSEILRDFVGNEVNPFLLEVAKFHDVADRANDPQLGKNARRLLHQFSDTLDDEQRAYFDSVLSNLQDVEDTAERCRENVGDKDSKLRKAISERKNRNQEIPSEMWLEESEITDTQEMSDLLDRVNLEAVLIKAAELLDNLIHPSTKDIAVFQDLHEAESFYAPLLEILGYDGFAMALRDQAFKIRLTKSGNGKFLEDAERLLKRLGDREDIAKYISKLFNSVGNDFFMDAIVSSISGQHEVQIGELVHSVPSDQAEVQERILRGVWRVKSVGSLAWKLFQKGEGYTPYDLIGISVIPEDVAGVAKYIGMFVTTLMNTDNVELVTTQSKREPVFIRGSKEFVNAVTDELDEDVSADIKLNNEGDFQVAKVNFRLLEEFVSYPCELQVLTEEDRVNSRIGSAAHFAYKARNHRKQPVFTRELLERIKSRRGNLMQLSTNTRSAESANAFNNIYKNSKY